MLLGTQALESRCQVPYAWLLQGSALLGLQARAAIESARAGRSGVVVAAISISEIGMLVAKGRLTLGRNGVKGHRIFPSRDYWT